MVSIEVTSDDASVGEGEGYKGAGNCVDLSFRMALIVYVEQEESRDQIGTYLKDLEVRVGAYIGTLGDFEVGIGAADIGHCSVGGPAAAWW